MGKDIRRAAVSGIVLIGLSLMFPLFKNVSIPEEAMKAAFIITLLYYFIYMVCYVDLMRGFKIVGKAVQSELLKKTAMLLMLSGLIYYSVVIFLMFVQVVPYFTAGFVSNVFKIIFGVIGIFFGIALIKLDNKFGKLAQWAGIFNIITSLFCLSVVFSHYVNTIIFITYSLEVLFLFKISNVFKEKLL